MTVRIGFIGAGRMASALIGGVISKGLYKADEIIASAPSSETRKRVSSEFGIKTYGTAAEVANLSDFIVIAVKPSQIAGLFAEKGLNFGPSHLLMSIVAGVKISTLEAYVPDAKIIRVMPNHCCLVGEGAAGYSRGSKADDRDVEKVHAVLSATGFAAEVKENDLDAVTGLSGSSPAFMYMVADAVAEAGTKNGIPRDVALKLAAQSMLGAAKMILRTGKSPERLRDDVCSPGGTTIEGVKVLQNSDAMEKLTEAVEASIAKSRKMSGE